MHKLPVYTSWHVGSSSCERKPSGSRLKCDVLSFHIGYTLAEDGTISGGKELHYKLGGEPPTQAERDAGVGHITGEIADVILKINDTLVDAVVQATGCVHYKDLPEELKKAVKDPSVPVMSEEQVAEIQRLAEYRAKQIAKESGDPNWMHAKPEPSHAKRQADVAARAIPVNRSMDILDPLPKPLLEKLKQYLPWILL